MNATHDDSPMPEAASDRCSVRNCQRPPAKRGMCNRCYLRWWRSTPEQERAPLTALERFFDKVDKNGPVPEHAPYLGPCWIWTGAARGDEGGHGQFVVSAERGAVPAHVYALELATGERCPDGHEGCHRCDNPPCCRPSHVYYGTRQQNVDDAWSRARHAVGSNRIGARLVEAEVEQIRIRYAGGESAATIAADFNLEVNSIYHITSGRKWRYAPGPITRRSSA